MSGSPDRHATDDPAAGQVVIYPWVCPFCTDGTWDGGVPCRHCAGRGLTDDVSMVDPTEHQLAPTPPAVMAVACFDCRYTPKAHAADRTVEPVFCHQDMPCGFNEVMSPAAWAGGMPLGYHLCHRWWVDIAQAATGEENASAR